MAIDYKEIHKRFLDGERDIDLAHLCGISVSTLYARFAELNLENPKKRTSEERWREEYEMYKNGKSATTIARDLDVRIATVYNHFYKLGLKSSPRKTVDREQFYADVDAGLSLDELIDKYKMTATYIRTLIRNYKSQKDL